MTTDQASPDMNFDWEQPLGESTDPPAASQQSAPSPVRSPVQNDHPSENLNNLSLLLDIPLEITAELGRTRMIINDLLQLGQGSVIELNKLAGEPLEIFVNNKLIARGEVVVVNEKFGIRLTDIISPMERIKQLA